MIPRVIHFIFGMDVTFGDRPFSFVHYLAIRSAAVVNPGFQLVLHFTHMPGGQWWEAARPHVSLNRVTAHENNGGIRVNHHAHRADLLRLQLLLEGGGVYVDLDTLCVRSFAPLLDHTVVMGIEPNAGLCNAVILAEAGSDFLRKWLDAYRTFEPRDWNYHSVRIPYELSLRYRDLIWVENEYAFFFPCYDDPMCAWLWKECVGLPERVWGSLKVIGNIPYYLGKRGPFRVAGYLRHALGKRESYYQQLRQAYSIHLWETLWWKPFLRDLGPARGSFKGCVNGERRYSLPG